MDTFHPASAACLPHTSSVHTLLTHLHYTVSLIPYFKTIYLQRRLFENNGAAFVMIDYCLEYGEIIAFVPIPAGQCSHALPFSLRATRVSASSISLQPISSSESDAPVRPSAQSLFRRSGFFTDGQDSRASAGTIITIKPRPSVKGSPHQSVEGRYVVVSITVQTEDNIDRVQQFVNELCLHDFFDLFMVDSNGHCYLARGVYPATGIKFTQKLPQYNRGEISIDVHCVNGVQPIIEDA